MTSYHYFLTYPANLGPMGIDELMRKLLVPRRWCHFLRTENQILINGHYLPLNFLVKAGNKIDIYLDHVKGEQQTHIASESLPGAVYEDSNTLITGKPAGQKTHPNLDERNTALNDRAVYLGYSPFIIHRLDMLTNGLLLMTRNPAAIPILNRRLTNKTLHRGYLAWVSKSNQLKQNGTISLPTRHGPNDQRKRMVRPDGQKAITHYEITKECENKALVKLTLETGHTHQIKVHLAAPNIPIISDPLYNPSYQKEESLQLTTYQLAFMKPFKFESKTVRLKQK